MLDPTKYQGAGFRRGGLVHLADGQAWSLPEPELNTATNPRYQDLILSIVAADNQSELLRAELALGIHLLMANYNVPPLILGALLDFPEGDPGLSPFQADLHSIAMEHVRAHRPPDDSALTPKPVPRLVRRFGIFGRAPASMSA